MSRKSQNKNPNYFPLLRNRRAQGISLNVIIIAAIALLVLVILSIIFIQRMAETRGEVDKCETNGGTCADDCAELGDYVREVTTYKCYYPSGHEQEGELSDQKCCIKI